MTLRRPKALKVLSNVPIDGSPTLRRELSERTLGRSVLAQRRTQQHWQRSIHDPSAGALGASLVNATVDTSGLERLISNLDVVEDVLRMVETRVDEAMVSGPTATFSDEGEEGTDMEAMSGDVIITASGERIPAGDGASRLKPDDEAPLVESTKRKRWREPLLACT